MIVFTQTKMKTDGETFVAKVILVLITFLGSSPYLLEVLICSHIYGMLLATSAYVVCILGVILMYIWYAPQPSCLLNIFFITWTLVLLQLMTSVSLHPKVCYNHVIVHSFSMFFKIT